MTNQANPTYMFGDDIQPIDRLFHKFMVHPIPCKINAIIAFELIDLSTRTHLLASRGCPHFLNWLI